MAIGGGLVDDRVGLAYNPQVLASVSATYKLKPREPLYYSISVSLRKQSRIKSLYLICFKLFK